MRLRVRSRLGKYKIITRLAEGGFANVYAAFDTIEGQRVALKIPRAEAPAAHVDLLRREIRLMARLSHPHILPIKNADEINGRLVIAYPLGIESLADRMRRRIGTTTALSIFEQMLDALEYAHSRRIIHCDVKPDNVILFPDNDAKLADFGLAKLARNTIDGSGSGTVGYLAPEQAMGRPSPRSDVFAAGLVLYRMLAGELPQWPFQWPLPRSARVRRKVSERTMSFLRRALDVDQRKRYTDAAAMKRAFQATGARRRIVNGYELA